jgi:hypothetical protein
MKRTPLRPSLKPIPRYTALRPVGPAKAKRDAKYKKYLASAAWKKKRDAVIARAAGNCERCGTPFGGGKIVAHHRTYIRLGNERLTDLEAICANCDRESHGNEMWRARHRRAGRADFGSLLAVLLLCAICALSGYAIGFDSACTKELPVGTSGIDHERSTTSAICVQESEWRDGLTVACGRAAR